MLAFLSFYFILFKITPKNDEEEITFWFSTCAPFVTKQFTAFLFNARQDQLKARHICVLCYSHRNDVGVLII